MEAADAEDEHVGPNGVQRFHGRGADDGLSVLREPPAEHRDLDGRMLRERHGDRRTVRDHGRLQIRRQAAGDLERRRPGVEEDHLPLTQEAAGRARDRFLGRRSLLAPDGVGPRTDRGGKRAAVDAPEEPGVRELAEVAADRVGRDRQLVGQVGRHDLAVAAKAFKDQVSSLFGQHDAHTSINVQIQAIFRNYSAAGQKIGPSSV